LAIFKRSVQRASLNVSIPALSRGYKPLITLDGRGRGENLKKRKNGENGGQKKGSGSLETRFYPRRVNERARARAESLDPADDSPLDTLLPRLLLDGTSPRYAQSPRIDDAVVAAQAARARADQIIAHRSAVQFPDIRLTRR